MTTKTCKCEDLDKFLQEEIKRLKLYSTSLANDTLFGLATDEKLQEYHKVMAMSYAYSVVLNELKESK